MDELDGADLGKGGKVFHEKAVAGALGVNPLVIVKAKVSTGLIKKFPGVGEIAWVYVEALADEADRCRARGIDLCLVSLDSSVSRIVAA